VEGESRAEQSVESMARQHARQLERSATTQRDRRRTYDTTTSNKTHNITARFTATGKQSQTKSQTINAQRVESSHRIAITTKATKVLIITQFTTSTESKSKSIISSRNKARYPKSEKTTKTPRKARSKSRAMSEEPMGQLAPSKIGIQKVRE
jgi:hypothetical protein